jgi:hypothetical protein
MDANGKHILVTVDYGRVPVQLVPVGDRARIVATRAHEQDAEEGGRSMPAWFNREDCVDPSQFDEMLLELLRLSR